MAAYLIANIDVKDSAAYDEYRGKVPALIRKHGGAVLVAGGRVVIEEGDWKPSRVILIRFADMATAQAFYDDPEYEPLKTLRKRAAQSELLFVEGD
jgi:uncharacterized protein (DUF1330 family)